MSYFHCLFCGRLNPEDAFFCDALHASAWRGQQENLKRWLLTESTVLQYYSPQEWEYSFLPLEEGGMKPNDDFIPTLKCEYCRKKYFDGEGVVTVKHTGRNTIQLYFCSETCGNEFYLSSLRKGGL